LRPARLSRRQLFRSGAALALGGAGFGPPRSAPAGRWFSRGACAGL